ncbi:MAG: vWA domain-containing protein [Polyangiaceae bacterium]
MTRFRTVTLVSLSCLVALGAVNACGDADDGSGFENPNQSTEDAASGDPGGSSDDDGSTLNPTSGGSGGSGGGGFEQCADTSDEAKLQPVAMYIVVDKSGSMDDNNKWDNAEQAFVAFFQDPAADDLKVALRFWPNGNCDSDNCSTDACAQPEVDVGLLSDPAHEAALVTAYQNEGPGGDTPMSAALAGATQWAVTYGAANPTEKAVVILVTDGEPNGCEEDPDDIAAYAAAAYASDGVLTFAVGLQGSGEDTMNTIAMAGGTNTGFFIGNANAAADLLAALKAIQESVVSCAFAMPEPTDPSSPIDPKLVNVTYTAGDGGPPQTIKQVQDASQCTAAGGWFYDNPVTPTTIELCPATCDAVQSDTGAKINIVLGCKTDVQ